MDSIPVKRCSKCGIEKPATREFFGSHPAGRYKLTGWCKTCANEQKRAKYANAAPVQAGQPDATKRCSKCKQEKAATLEYFPPNKLGKYGLGGWCRRCSLDAQAARFKANPELYTIKASGRRALVLQAGGKFFPRDVRQQLKGQQGLCYWCRQPLETGGKGKYHVDHLIPLSRGGSNGPENIVCSCPTCNRSRNNKLPHEWTNRLL